MMPIVSMKSSTDMVFSAGAWTFLNACAAGSGPPPCAARATPISLTLAIASKDAIARFGPTLIIYLSLLRHVVDGYVQREPADRCLHLVRIVGKSREACLDDAPSQKLGRLLQPVPTEPLRARATQQQ